MGGEEATPLGERLRELRVRRGLSLDDLAAAAGISRAYLWKLEKKPDSNPSLELLEKLANGLGTTVGRLLPGGVSSGDQRDVALPPSLVECQKQYRLKVEDVQDLARINFRGGHPVEADDWYQLFLTLRRAVGDSE
ncbi:MAG TPA: helix-turn-helix transcriptional regulator [Vicinamibacteria bacterium]|nr:helix-turn-helix transcriptional regulator [Vicinamibacteria bacterium]